MILTTVGAVLLSASYPLSVRLATLDAQRHRLRLDLYCAVEGKFYPSRAEVNVINDSDNLAVKSIPVQTQWKRLAASRKMRIIISFVGSDVPVVSRFQLRGGGSPKGANDDVPSEAGQASVEADFAYAAAYFVDNKTRKFRVYVLDQSGQLIWHTMVAL